MQLITQGNKLTMPTYNDYKAISFSTGTFFSGFQAFLEYFASTTSQLVADDQNETVNTTAVRLVSDDTLNVFINLSAMVVLFCLACYSYVKNKGVEDDIALLRNPQTDNEIKAPNIPELRQSVEDSLKKFNKDLNWAKNEEYIIDKQVAPLREKLRFFGERYTHSLARHRALMITLYLLVLPSLWDNDYSMMGIAGPLLQLAFASLLPISHIMLASRYRAYYQELTEFYHGFLVGGMNAVVAAGEAEITERDEQIKTLEAQCDKQHRTITALEETVEHQGKAIEARDGAIVELEHKLRDRESTLAQLQAEKQQNQALKVCQQQVKTLEARCGTIEIKSGQLLAIASTVFRPQVEVAEAGEPGPASTTTHRQ